MSLNNPNSKWQFFFLFTFIFSTVITSGFLRLAKAQPLTYTDISVNEAFNMINDSATYPDLIVLDVRTQGEYDIEHLCNATLIPVGELESRISEILPYNDSEIIVYCGIGGRSATASQILVNHVFTKVFNMLTGISGWITAEYDVCPTDGGSNGQPEQKDNPTIGFSLNFFFIILVGTVLFVTLYVKKHRNAN